MRVFLAMLIIVGFYVDWILYYYQHYYNGLACYWFATILWFLFAWNITNLTKDDDK
jgi:hypothetical protein